MKRLSNNAVCLLAALGIMLPAVAFTAGDASASCIGAHLEFREGQREVARERREVRRAVRNADSRSEARRAIREGAREIAREKREMRREIIRELRPWC